MSKKKKILLINIVIFILVCFNLYYLYVIFNKKKKKEKFNNHNHINFLNRNDCKNFIISDDDDYVKKFNRYDLIARNVKSSNEYIEKTSKCFTDFTDKQKNVLRLSCKNADMFFENYNILINGKELLNIPWNLALSKYNNNYEYEEGLPHTRNNIIFLSEKIIPNEINSEIISLLIHEKIHIYQRYNKAKINKVIEKLGYKEIDNMYIDKIRSNPDLNNTIYIDKENNVSGCIYNSDNPNSITDANCINSDVKLEHPYELMAYQIADLYKYNNMEIYKNI